MSGFPARFEDLAITLTRALLNANEPDKWRSVAEQVLASALGFTGEVKRSELYAELVKLESAQTTCYLPSIEPMTARHFKELAALSKAKGEA